MTLEKFNTWFSMGTNVAVLLGVILLVVEINQNTRTLEIQADDARWAQWTALNRVIASSPDLADILVRGSADLASLTPAELLRFGQVQTNLLNVVEHSFRQELREGGADNDIPLAAVLREQFKYPGVLAYYEQNKIFFLPEFTNWADQFRPPEEGPSN